MSLRVKELLSIGEQRLLRAGIADAAIDHKDLYCYLMHIPRSRLVLEYNNTIQDSLCDAYFSLIDRRATGEPLQYIIGEATFMGLPFFVDKRVLIPRFDTEVLVETAISLIQRCALPPDARVSRETKGLYVEKQVSDQNSNVDQGAFSDSLHKTTAKSGIHIAVYTNLHTIEQDADSDYKINTNGITANKLRIGIKTKNNIGTETIVLTKAEKRTKEETKRGMDIGKETIMHQNASIKIPRIKNVLDLCTGSGAIGISLAKFCPGIEVTCSDISTEALTVAQANAKRNGVTKQVHFNQGDLFEPFEGRFRNKHFDLIICNPPYISERIIPTLQKEVRQYEPISALNGGEDGLAFYKRLADTSYKYLSKGGIILLEIGYDQQADVHSIFEQTKHYSNFLCLKDLAGLDRIFLCRVKEK